MTPGRRSVQRVIVADEAVEAGDPVVEKARGCARLCWTTKEDNATARRLYDRIARFNGFIRYDYPLG